MTESALYTKLKVGFTGFKIKMTRIETGGTVLGVPDITYRTVDQDGWIELKILPTYPRNHLIEVPFRPGQFRWIDEYRGLNGAVFLFLVIDKDLWVIRSHYIREVYQGDLLPAISEHRFQIVGRSDVNWSWFYDTLNRLH